MFALGFLRKIQILRYKKILRSCDFEFLFLVHPGCFGKEFQIELQNFPGNKNDINFSDRKRRVKSRKLNKRSFERPFCEIITIRLQK